ncbi:acyltransferase family protein [Klebsiella pneumoniae]|uniref:acyltransferase family protein n=1 Tax=Klebsiella pneumoniae TaxID=573 RepID=UPI000CEC2F17|nr:acyltransferase [Klebsiella pneumoniae]EIY5142388.1 acyltransferase [Klebsiella variicola]RDB00569.1 acyltransferase [Klebsiella oxytoca]MBD7568346.1 acyltransferase [Klebsiella pneumoniae]MCB3251027.1 acyltransferase [Klebsiella pneumoniae]PUH12869.1 acyltransferase [Klebsiella pneumoniae]
MISIQVLRGFAALLVVLVHSTLKAQSTGLGERVFEIGHSGVDLFFIISGFIMMMIGARENNFFLFMSKRITRVIPLYYITTTVALCIYLFNPSLINGNNGVISILHSYLLIPAQGKSFLLSVGWTLSYEMFFYIVFACIVFMKSSAKGIAACLILIALVVAGRYSSNVTVHNFMSIILLEFAIGIGCFYFYDYMSKRLSEIQSAAISTIFILIAVAWIGFQQDPIFTLFNNRVIELAIPMMFIFLAFCLCEFNFKKYKQTVPVRIMSYIGDASYSLYLTHLFALGIVSKIYAKLGVENYFVFVTTCVVASVIGGVLCYEIVEKRITAVLRNTIYRKPKKLNSDI